MTHLRLMADYFCYPIWDVNEDGILNVDPAELPISKKLAVDLDSWAQTFDDILDQNDPGASAFPSEDAAARFKQDGEALGCRLRGELGPDYLIEILI